MDLHDVAADIDAWLAQGEEVALATVVSTWGSAPRQVGAKMAMTAAGAISGSVSGGCVEGAVFDVAMEVLATGRPQLLHFGVADETAWEVGLACGGAIEVFVDRLDPAVYHFGQTVARQEQPGATLTVIRGPEEWLGRKVALGPGKQRLGSLGNLDEAAVQAAESVAQSQRLAVTEDTELFVDVLSPSPTLILVGGVHIAVALTALARTLGYHTIVVDPRRAFGSEARFPHADRLIQAWPDEAFAELELTPATAVALLTHDPKIDDPALKIVLESPAFYVGALGSKATHAKRRRRLLEAGLSQAQVDRIHGPIGLDIGAQTPAEIALAVLAEIVQARRQPAAEARPGYSGQ
jgi:xanthine dehydrogenase accessory factor